MNASDHRTVWGYIYAWKPKLRERDDWYKSATVRCSESVASGWFDLNWTRDAATNATNPEPATETFHLRLSRRRFVLLGRDPKTVHTFLRYVGIEWMVTRPAIDVHQAAIDFVARPSEYCLGGVWARVEGQSECLRTMGLYGNDLAEAALFRNLLPFLTCTQVRLRDVRRGVEVITVGARAEIGLSDSTPKNLSDAEAALGFLSKRKYVAWGDQEEAAQ